MQKPLKDVCRLWGKYADILLRYSPIVLGEGKKEAAIFMIGEAPGKHEIERGAPFVGTAGKNLDGFLKVLQLKREEIYLTNAVKFRPVKENPRTKRLSNRAPTPKEIELFHPMLMDEIDIIKPSVIVTLGNIPLSSITGKKQKIGDLHGVPIRFQNRILYPLYHPASIIYRQELKKVYMQDLTHLKSLLGTLKQEG